MRSLVRCVVAGALAVASVAMAAAPASAGSEPLSERPIVFTTSEGVVRIAADGSDRRVIAPVDEDPGGRIRYGAVDVSPDGTKVVFTGCAEGAPAYFPNCDLLVVGIDGEGLRALPLGRALAPRWSPDGRMIAFLGPVGSQGSEVRVAVLDGSGARTFGAGSAPAWMPGGRSLIVGRVVSQHEGFVSSALFVVPLDGGAPRQLGPALPGEVSQPRVSPDGSTIAVRRGPAVTLLNIEGSGVRDLHGPDMTTAAGAVAWSPEGTHVALPGVPGTEESGVVLEDITSVVEDQTLAVLPGTEGATSVAWAAGTRPSACPHGYWLAAADGGVFTYGGASFHGSAASLPLRAPVVGIAPTPSGRGYWLAAADGGVFSYGDARFHGSAATLPLRAPVVGIAASRSGAGYRLVAADGGVFTFGDARFAGSAAGLHLQAPVVGVADLGHPEAFGGPEYHLVAADGGVFSFSTHGDAHLGSPAELRLPGPWAAMSLDPTGSTGYWVTAADGRVFNAGGVRQVRRADRPGLGSPVVATAAFGTDAFMAATADGGVVPYGTARWCGSRAGQPLAKPVVALAAAPAPS